MDRSVSSQMTRLRWVASVAVVAFCALSALAGADTVTTADGLSAEATQASLQDIRIAGEDLGGVSVEVLLVDPATKQPASDRFTVTGAWTVEGNCLRLDGAVVASGEEDCVADLIIRIRGSELALSTMGEDPLLQPRSLLSKLPLVSLRTGDQDRLALAVPPDRLAIFEFSQPDEGVELRYPFGFTVDARPDLRMRAPFTCVLYRTDPAWHFRSALAGYYALFPELFEPFIREQGGWFFAAPTADLPNPQHFYYHEGGPGGWEMDDERGLGTYPYRESSSYTISLAGNQLPQSYAEIKERFDALADEIHPVGWSPMRSFALDGTIKHSGERSVLADSGDAGNWTGVSQTITLDPPVEGPILVSGLSRAEGITGDEGNDYAVYVDVVYASGNYLFGQCATFKTGTHDWEEGAYTIQPTEPVAELRTYCLLRGHKGRAWFDDVHVGPADEPEVNWFENPGFEATEKRADLQFIRDNVCVNSRGEDVVRATDNLSADVGPSVPLNLLRFTLNVDPDIPSTEAKPSVAAGQFDAYDKIFRDQPSVDGCYIDSVSAWVSGVLNCRRDQWPAHDTAFTYDAGNLKVAAHGRFAMADFLGALQERYHPLGKPVFTNIHVDRNSFPLYLVSDVPGIESSEYRNEDSMFFYRACSYHKPLLLLNFMNLHDLDKREFAELYHLNAAQWGEFPSTGRFVQRAYDEYGDVTHAYMPAIKDLGEAGWEPIPLASGARVERFAGDTATYFTVRAPQSPASETLTVQPGALANLGDDLVAMDAVSLAELPMTRQDGGCEIAFTHGDGELHIVRISSRADAAKWLLERARRHAVNASRVQGKASETPELLAAVSALTDATGADSGDLTACRDALIAAEESVDSNLEDLFALSRWREVLQSQTALNALAVLQTGGRIEILGAKTGYPGQAMRLEARGPEGARLVRFEVQPARQIVPPLEAPDSPAAACAPNLVVQPDAPGTSHAVAWFSIPGPGGKPWTVARQANLFALPAAELSVSPGESTDASRGFIIKARRGPHPRRVVLKPELTPPAAVQPAELALAEGESELALQVSRVVDGAQRVLVIRAVDDEGNELASTQTSFRDEPPVPADDLALAAAGAKVTSDSAYSGYDPAVTIDGVVRETGIHWTQRAWASSDSELPHWLQVDFPAPTAIREVRVYWNAEEGRTYTSQRYDVIGLTADGPVKLASVDTQGPASMTAHAFASTTVSGIRIEQPAQGGPAFRPGIMWVREVCVTP